MIHANAPEPRLGVHVLTPLDPASPSMITEAYKLEFENGYGASIIIGTVSFNHWELAVIHNGKLCYATPITSDVLRVNQWDDLEPILDTLAGLPHDPNCTHEREVTC